MKRIITILLCLSLVSWITCLEAQDITTLVPGQGELSGWEANSNSTMAAGDDLFLLINGGADIYLEYGFEQAVFQSYTHGQDQIINLELYQMSSVEAAYGIYTFKTGKKGKSLDIGQEGYEESYYLNIWQGPFLITLIGLDESEETREGLRTIARQVCKKIEPVGDRPSLVNLMPEEGLDENRITYFAGNLGFFNLYLFDSSDLFGIKKGVMGSYGATRIFLLEYDSEKQANDGFVSARQFLTQSTAFRTLESSTDVLKLVDKEKQSIVIRSYRNFIVIQVGEAGPETKGLYSKVLENIDTIAELAE